MAIELNDFQPKADSNKPEGSLLDRLKGDKKSSSLSSMFKGRVSDKDRMFFTEQLSLLLETGTSLLEALQAIASQTENAAFGLVIDDLIETVKEGQPFSYALAQHPKIFSSTYINLMYASEGGGFMPQVLAELLEMDEKRQRLNATLKSALSYPAFLMLFSLGVVIFVLVVVFPKFSEMFASIHDQLPASTKVLMWTSHFLIHYWYAVIGVLITLCFVAYRWLISEQGGSVVDALKLKMPVIKHIFIELYLVQSLRVMGLSLGNGVSVMDTLSACRDVVNNRVYKDFIRTVEEGVEEGKGFAQGFNQSQFIPSIVQQMVTTGETSGSLPKIMQRVSSYYERQLEQRLETLAKAAEPLMLLVMGVVVGLLVSSLILPIFKLSKAVG